MKNAVQCAQSDFAVIWNYGSSASTIRRDFQEFHMAATLRNL